MHSEVLGDNLYMGFIHFPAIDVSSAVPATICCDA
jgi:hypothetical protein